MDPDATLKALRKCMDEDERGFDRERASELFWALDQWLCTGGFLPKDWEKSWNHTTGL